MSNEPSHMSWGAELLWEQLQPLMPGISIEVVARADSTNSQLIDRARMFSGRRDQPVTIPGALELQDRDEHSPHGRRTGDTHPCLLVAESQTRGRGRHGRNWQSSTGASLTFSLAVALSPRDWSGLSLAVGVALAEALEAVPGAGGPAIGLKWPNDLWLMDAPGSGRKLGGVLIETVMVGSRRMAIVGVGLNVAPQPTRDLSSGYACLQERQPGVDAPAALHQVAAPLAAALLLFEREGFAAFAGRFAQRDLLRGQPITTTLPQVPAGVADGVGEDGSLRVRVGQGADAAVQLVSSGDVSVRIDGN
ncbi:biotin--[acetyl-CoA-carboxylase] ligase [Aquincola sp. MAHUQ-54]|uniref:Biotin--[acetyl-CoA-carboxylase] ligase n=1 Tax=Aquincola agrisoli TaxID=3119538 RepID=A0AAW9QHE7_9BURK